VVACQRPFWPFNLSTASRARLRAAARSEKSAETLGLPRTRTEQADTERADTERANTVQADIEQADAERASTKQADAAQPAAWLSRLKRRHTTSHHMPTRGFQVPLTTDLSLTACVRVAATPARL